MGETMRNGQFAPDNCYMMITEADFLKFVVLSICDNVNEGFIQFQKLKNNQRFSKQIACEVYGKDKNVARILEFVNLIPELDQKYLLIELLYDEVMLKKDTTSAHFVQKALYDLADGSWSGHKRAEQMIRKYSTDQDKFLIEIKQSIEEIQKEVAVNTARSTQNQATVVKLMESVNHNQVTVAKFMETVYQKLTNQKTTIDIQEELGQGDSPKSNEQVSHKSSTSVRRLIFKSKRPSQIPNVQNTKAKVVLHRQPEHLDSKIIEQQMEIDRLDKILKAEASRFPVPLFESTMKVANEIKKLEKTTFDDNKKLMETLKKKIPIVISSFVWQEPVKLRCSRISNRDDLYLTSISMNKITLVTADKNPSNWIFESNVEKEEIVFYLKSSETGAYMFVTAKHEVRMSTQKHKSHFYFWTQKIVKFNTSEKETGFKIFNMGTNTYLSVNGSSYCVIAMDKDRSHNHWYIEM